MPDRYIALDGITGDRPSPDRRLVLVTGGAGFIGSHTVDALLAAGCRVVVIDDFSAGRPDNLSRWGGDPRVTIVAADITEGLSAPLAGAAADIGRITHVVHLAAQTLVQKSLIDPFADIRVNYEGTLHVLEYARRFAARRVVFASSSAVYGDGVPVPTGEDAATRPLSPYGINKLASEILIRQYAAAYGVATTIFRFFNVYGPRQDPHNPYSGVISIFAGQALAGEPLTIYGDGGQTRDFIFVTDVSRILAAACLDEGGGGGAGGGPINLGTGIGTSILDLAQAIVSLARAPSRIVHAPARAGETYRSVAAIDRCIARIPLRPAVPLEEGLVATLAWMRARYVLAADSPLSPSPAPSATPSTPTPRSPSSVANP